MSTTRMRGLSDAYGSWKIICILSCCRRASDAGEARERLPAPEALAGGQRQQSDGEAAERRLAAPRFADQPDDFAGRDREVDVVHRMHDLLAHVRAERDCRSSRRDRATSRSASTRRAARRAASDAHRRRGVRHQRTADQRMDSSARSASRRRSARIVRRLRRDRAIRSRTRAALAKRAAGRQLEQRRRHARESAASRPPRTLFDGTESSSPRVYGCARRSEDRSRAALLDDASRVHHADAIGEPGDRPRGRA